MTKSLNEIDVKKISDPTEKMELMYEAVISLVSEGNDLSKLTISAITSKAGIGKGTAYEYFTSKEELIAYALMYEYSNKLQNLAEHTFKVVGFKDRIYSVMNWIAENKEYNKMFSSVARIAFSNEQADCDSLLEFFWQFIFAQIDLLIEDGKREGIIAENDPGNYTMALLTSMIEYGAMVMMPPIPRFSTQTDAQRRDFIYNSLIGAIGNKQ